MREGVRLLGLHGLECDGDGDKGIYARNRVKIGAHIEGWTNFAWSPRYGRVF